MPYFQGGLSESNIHTIGISKPSVSHGVKLLRKGGFLTKDGNNFLHLNDWNQKKD